MVMLSKMYSASSFPYQPVLYPRPSLPLRRFKTFRDLEGVVFFPELPGAIPGEFYM